MIDQEPFTDEMLDKDQYRETFRILDKTGKLTAKKFDVAQKEELIEKLQKTIMKLNGLLFQLEYKDNEK
jgi:hypothetical protein